MLMDNKKKKQKDGLKKAVRREKKRVSKVVIGHSYVDFPGIPSASRSANFQ